MNNFPTFPAGSNIKEAIQWLKTYCEAYDNMLSQGFDDDTEQKYRDDFNDKLDGFISANGLPDTDPETLISKLEKQLPQ